MIGRYRGYWSLVFSYWVGWWDGELGFFMQQLPMLVVCLFIVIRRWVKCGEEVVGLMRKLRVGGCLVFIIY